MEGVLPDGSTHRTVVPEREAGEELSAFVLLDNGFCIARVVDHCEMIDQIHDRRVQAQVIALTTVRTVIAGRQRSAPGLHGDERMAALEAECERLVGLGATRLRRDEPAPPTSAGYIVMADPEGNEFCLD
ncbi:VOC family protein [Streptomyces lunaelactis]|uniref:VOC family protein n=1 Tax=Streptomyces lunaelactis TaxID=1535768 RepID=UPI0020C7C307|nr:VOC family protein [Streptomyces lunaelactis]